MSARVAAVVPVLDERDAIGDVITGLRSAGACCVLIVDGGSRDGTRAVANAAGAIVVDERRRGYGRACLTGAQRALEPRLGHTHDAVAFLDGDGSCDPADLPKLVSALARADVVLGRRPGRLLDPRAMSWHARLGNRLVATIVRIGSRRPVHDLPPMKVIERTSLARLRLDEAGYGWTVQLVARALGEPSLRVEEVPVTFRARRGGVSKVSGSWTTSLRAGRAMVAVAINEMRAAPVIALMAKAPGPGHAKTRLAVDLGEEHTAEMWAACLADVAEAARSASIDAGARPIVMLARTADVDPVVRIVGPNWIPLVQRRPGLGAALTEAFLAAFDRGADRALAVAGDAPALPPSRIRAALAALDHEPLAAVIGPSRDGGYHLVGLRWSPSPIWLPPRVRGRARARLECRLDTAFRVVPMGGGSAAEATRRALAGAGWHVSTVASWPDVDTVADLRRLARSLDEDGRWAPRTAEWVRGHRDVIDGPTLEPAPRAQDERP